MTADRPTDFQRQQFQIQGIVQGVGFRPFVYRLALQFGLVGFVYNDNHGVTIEVEGASAALASFHAALITQMPPLARIDSIAVHPVPLSGESAFTIVHSQNGDSPNTLISPDVATCDDCLRELLDPSDRRYRYPFINCTNCGPRFTIVLDTPYDRDKTTMRTFPMCPQCAAEYVDPLNRRFHAQPNACPVCGPRLERGEQPVLTDIDALDLCAFTADQLVRGEIVAIKGLGGFHLACDALNADAVAELRRRKHREAKPFALMVPDLATARQLCEVSDAEAELLQSRRRPIVLLSQRPETPVAAGVAPRYTTLGLMLPYTPLHTLLLHDIAHLRGEQQPVCLVMTSGNLSDEPIVYRNADAAEHLRPITSNLLLHNRDIHTRCDDSVARIVAGGVQMVRRSRGYVPEPISLKNPLSSPILAVGGQLKNTFCLGKERQAFLSHHIGDLENLETLTAFTEGVAHMQRLFDIQPAVVAYDLHPDYLSTKYALALDLPRKIGVQHHHAHIASVMAEHGLTDPVIGIAADGTGYGTDGAIWGGEVLVADLRGFERAAHLAYIPLPGGEQAIRQPWRMAAVYLQRSFGDDFLTLPIPFVQRMNADRWRVLSQMIAVGLNSPPTSSLGRLFDAVAALIGIRDEVVYEGQAAIELETHAAPVDQVYPFAITDSAPMIIDVLPTIRAIVQDLQQGRSTAVISGQFHRTIAALIVALCERVRAHTGLRTVALSGGLFQNKTLVEQLLPLLEAAGFQPYLNRLVPPNDGGLSLGQLAIAAALTAP